MQRHKNKVLQMLSIKGIRWPETKYIVPSLTNKDNVETICNLFKNVATFDLLRIQLNDYKYSQFGKSTSYLRSIISTKDRQLSYNRKI